MNSLREAFSQKAWVWMLPALFVSTGVLAIALYQAAFAGDAAVLHRNIERQARVLKDLRTERRQVEGFLEEVRVQSDAADILYRDYFSTEAERFTTALREMRHLAGRAGLSPSTFNYPETKVDDYGLVLRNINFGVEGTYDQLRTFINLLELTDQFLTLESVNLGGGAAERDPRLKIALSLSTYFIEDPKRFSRDVPPDPPVEEDTGGEDGEDGDGENGEGEGEPT